MSYKHYELEPRLLLDAAALVTIGDLNDTKSDASTNDVAGDSNRSESGTQLSDIEQLVSDLSSIDSSTDDVTQIIFVDSRVIDDGYEIEAQENTLVVILDIDTDGIEQITDTLVKYDALESIHIISHGDDGELLLGKTILTTNDLNGFQEQIATWQDSTTDSADLLLYGCNVAESETGQEFVDLLASMSGMDVAASTDTTGAYLLGGDSDLEYAAGDINSKALSLNQSNVLLDSASVTSAANNGPVVEDSSATLNEESDPDSPTSQTITNNMLSVTDTESAASDVTYTVTALPTEGTLFLSGGALSENNTFTQADIDNGLLTFTSSGSEETTDSFTYSVVDGDANELTGQTFSITFTPYSDPIEADISLTLDNSNNVDTTITVTEGEELILSSTDLLYSSDSANDITYTIDSLTLSEGTLSLSGVTLSAGNTFTQSDINAGNVTYTHNGDEPTGTQAFTFTVSNGDNSETGTLTISVTSENDTPVPTGDGLTVDEGGSGNFTGTIIHNDPDNSDVQIMYTITSLPNDGVLALNGVSISTGTLVAASNLGNLTYTHDGSEGSTDSFTVSVNDGAGGTVDSYTVDIAVTPINDQVSVVAGNEINEGEEFAPVTITITDADDSLTDITVQIDSLPADGILYFDADGDGNVDASDEVTAGMIAAGFSVTANQTGQFYFSHDGNDNNNGNPDDVSFTITVTDNGGNTNDSSDTTSVTTGVILTVIPVDDDSTLGLNTGTALTIDTADSVSYSQTITNTMLQVGDVDSSDTNLVYTLISIPSDGILIVDGAILGVGGTFSQEDINNGDVVFTYTGETNGEVLDNFTFTVLDSAYNSDADRDGGIFDASDSLVVSTFNITIQDTYITTGQAGFYVDIDTVYVDEGSVSNTITNAYLNASDDVSTDSQLVYTLDSTTTNGTLWLDGDGDGVLDSGEELSVGSTFTQQNIEDSLLHYDTDGSETASDSFQFDLSDSDGENVDDQTFNVGIRAINDAPVIETNETLYLDEGATAAITTSLLSVSDVDNDVGALNASEMLITLNTLPANGTVYLSGTALGQYDSFTYQNVIDGVVTFEHNGTEDFQSSFDFTVSDGGLTDTGTFNISATPINDTPVFSDAIVTLIEGGSATLTVLSGSDVDGNNTDDSPDDDTTNPSTDTLSYTITTIPTHGTLTHSGAVVAVNDVFTSAQLASLIYSHDGSEEYSDSFIVSVDDQSGQSNATSSGTVTLQISPVNDDPVYNNDASGAVLHEGQSITISSSGSALITDVSGVLSATDPDSLAVQIQFRITDGIENGTLELQVNGSWVEIGVGSVFTQDDLNKSYLRYTADPDYQADAGVAVDDSFSFTISDAGGGNEPTGTFNINILPVNDTPEITVPSSQNASESTPFTISGLSFDDADVATTDSVTVTLSVSEETIAQGTLTLATTSGITFTTGDGDADSTMTFTGTLSDVNAAVAGLIYTPTDEYAGTTTVSVSIDDLGNTGDDPDTLTSLGLSGDGVSTSESASSSFTIEVAAINEAPTITLVSDTATVNEDDSVVISGVTFGDPDSIEDGWDTTNELTVTLSVGNGTISLPTIGGLSTQAGDGTGTVTLTGTIDDLNAAVASITYSPELNFDENDTLTITLNDNGNFGSGGALESTETIGISVAPVDDDPTINSPTDETVDEDTNLVFTLDFETVDSGTAADPVPDAFQVTSLPNDGVLYFTNADGSSTGFAVSANTTYTEADTAFVDGEPQLIFVLDSDQNDTSLGGEITFTYSVSDDSGTNYTADATGTISISAVNDAPTLSLTDAGTSYIETSVGAGTAVQVASAVTISDLEIDGNNSENVNYNNATLTVERSVAVTNSDSDVYSISDSTGGIAVSVSGTDVIIAGNIIGSVSGNGTSSLVVTFNGSADQSDVEAVATSIAFANDSDAPGSSATVAFIFNDGNDSNEQGSGGSLESTATVEVAIVQSNDAPVAADNTNSINEDAISGVTGNVITDDDTTDGVDSDSDNSDTLTISNITYDTTTTAVTSASTTTITAEYGNLSIAEDGSYTYTITDTISAQALPAGGTLTETFTYEVSDGNGGLDTAVLVITIAGTNDAPVITSNTTAATGSVTEAGNSDDGTVVAGTATTSGTLTSSDVDSTSTATWSGDATGTYGDLVINSSTGEWTYTLDNSSTATQALDEGDSVTETFTVTVTDDQGSETDQTITVTVNGANDLPTVINDTGSVTENTTLTITAANGVISTDSDVDDSAVLSVTNIADGTTTETISSGASGVITSSYGTLTINDDGSYTYVANGADSEALVDGTTATDTFTYTLTDAEGAATTATLIVTITGTNDNPVITSSTTDSTGSVTEAGNADDGTVVAGTATTSGTLTSSDVDVGSTATWSGDATGSYGSLVIGSSGKWTYTLDNSSTATQALDEGDSVTETFTVTVTDDDGGKVTQDITITVTGTNDIPVATTLSNQTGEDGDTITSIDVSTAFSDVDASDTLTFIVSNLPAGLSIDPNTGIISGTIGDSVSTGGDNSDGIYVVTVTATDAQGASVVSIFNYTVDITREIAIDDTNTITEGTVSVAGDVLTNDIDVTAVTANTTGVQTGTYGTLTINSNGSYEYALDNTNTAVQALAVGATLTENFSYTTTDSFGKTDTASITITIDGANSTPTVTSLSDQSNEDGAVITSIDVSSAFDDVDTSDTLTYSAVNLPTGLSIDSNTGVISGTLDSSASQGSLGSDGVYIVTINATDTSNEMVSADFTYTVTNPGPNAVDNSDNIDNDETSITGNVLTNDSDDDSLTVDNATDQIGTYGTLSLNSDGSYTYVLDPTNVTVQALSSNETLTEIFTYTVSDGEGGSNSADLNIIINTPDSIVASNNSITTNSNNISENALNNTSDSYSPTTTNNNSNNDVVSFEEEKSPLSTVYEGLLSVEHSESINPLSLQIILEDHVIGIEGIESFSLPENAFQHTDPNETITVEVTLSDGSELPNYILFDLESGTFEVDGAEARKLEEEIIVIRVTARDSDGNSASSTFTIVINQEANEELKDENSIDKNKIDEGVQTQIKESKQLIESKSTLGFGLQEQLQTLGEGEFALQKAQLLMDIKQLLG